MFKINVHAPVLYLPVPSNIFVSFSGGRTSALMAKLMKEMPEYKRHNLLFAFSNTGKERIETLDFVERCDKEFGLNLIWVEAEVHPTFGIGTKYRRVDYTTANRDGKPFEEMIAKFGIPNQSFKHCSRELKFRPLNALAKDYFNGANFVTALGMRFDEMSRVGKSYNIDSGYLYPMVEMEIRVEDVREFWNDQPFDLRLKDYEGNCDLCWKKSLRKKMTILKEDPKVADWWHIMEEKYGILQIPHRQKLTARCVFNRNHMTIPEMLKLAMESKFELVTDPFYDEEEHCACSAGNPLEESDEE